MSVLKIISVSVMTLVIGSCGSPRSTQSQDGVGQENYLLEYQDVMEFVRGVEAQYKIKGEFVDGSEATVSMDGLPNGAKFEKGTLTWKPSCQLAPENGQFLRGYMVHRVRISLSGNKSDHLVQKPAMLIVHLEGEGSFCQD